MNTQNDVTQRRAQPGVALGRWVRLCVWDAMLAWYLVLVLALWPMMVAAVKIFECGTWREAQRYTWHRWNEIRTTWRYSVAFEPNVEVRNAPRAENKSSSP